MRTKQMLLIGAVLLANATVGFAQATPFSEGRVRILRNSDVLVMVKRGATPGEIIAKIRTSQCGFDTFPSVQRELRMRGVPESVISAMAMVPNGPPSVGFADRELRAQKTKLTLPAGTTIEVETAFSVSSSDLEKGNRITFLVTRPIYVNSTLAIARNAVATARVVETSKAQGWGRPGSLTWEMEDVVAVDGTRIPIRVSESLKGSTRVPTILAGAAATAALVFPYTSPAALVWAFKKGDDAVLFGSRRFTALVREDAEVAGLLSRPREEATYHPVATLRRATSESLAMQTGSSGFGPSGSFLPGGSFLPSVSFRPSGSFLPGAQR